MIVLIDNYDSFTYNLVHVMAPLGVDIRVYRNDAVTVDGVAAMQPEAVIVSPGPCTPAEAGISIELVRRLTGVVPILGVCLGHQSIAAAFGATVSQARRIMHGKVSQVRHDGFVLYRGLANPFPAGRYHSLAVLRDTLPPELVPDAFSEDGEIMGMHHLTHRTFGVQFHPESVLTPSGKRLLRNFVEIVRAGAGAQGKEERG
jgi:anthranilate synthase/aminodeoxychorismate synthase-like glutamine amidotransferase